MFILDFGSIKYIIVTILVTRSEIQSNEAFDRISVFFTLLKRQESAYWRELLLGTERLFLDLFIYKHLSVYKGIEPSHEDDSPDS